MWKEANVRIIEDHCENIGDKVRNITLPSDFVTSRRVRPNFCQFPGQVFRRLAMVELSILSFGEEVWIVVSSHTTHLILLTVVTEAFGIVLDNEL